MAGTIHFCHYTTWEMVHRDHYGLVIHHKLNFQELENKCYSVLQSFVFCLYLRFGEAQTHIYRMDL